MKQNEAFAIVSAVAYADNPATGIVTPTERILRAICIVLVYLIRKDEPPK